MEIFRNLLRLFLLVFCVLIVIAASYLIPFLISIRPRRSKESGFSYVYVNNDGTARELSSDEQEYLETKFEGGDGGRPYIKSHYFELTPDGKMNGYLWRRHLPKRVNIDPNPKETRSS